MRLQNLVVFVVFSLFISSGCTKKEELKFCLWDYNWMLNVKSELNSADNIYQPAFERIMADAGKALNEGPFSVTYKDTVPPGGTINDYMSLGPYWWPDPEKPDGLPYIRRDGERNPEFTRFDRPQLDSMINNVRTLSIAWFFSEDKVYARKAADLLRVWFLDPETLMNPHLEFGQAIPGRTTGRGIGIIETRYFFTVTDAIILLEASDVLSSDEIGELRDWFSEYLHWLTESQHGKDEDEHPNNHSIAYDLQTSGIAFFTSNMDYVQRKIGEMPERRIDEMISSDGSQPAELIRTRAFHYSVSNLGNYMDAGEIGLRGGVDIFSHVTPDGGSLRKALDYLIDYIGREDEWPYEQIYGWDQSEDELGLLIRRAARIYNCDYYQSVWEDLFYERVCDNWSLLVIPGQ